MNILIVRFPLEQKTDISLQAVKSAKRQSREEQPRLQARYI